MATGDNAILPLFTPADDLTAAVSAAVSAGKFVKISGNIQASPILDITAPLTKGNLITVATCGAGDKAIGVSKWDAAAVDDPVGLFTGGQIVPMTAGASITAGVEVESNASGNPITLASGKANGIAVSTAAGAATVYVKLYG